MWVVEVEVRWGTACQGVVSCRAWRGRLASWACCLCMWHAGRGCVGWVGPHPGSTWHAARDCVPCEELGGVLVLG